MCSSNSFWGENSWWPIIAIIVLLWICCGQNGCDNNGCGCGSCGSCGCC